MGDIKSCSSYRGIKLMSRIMKFGESIIEYRLRQNATVTENRFGFMLAD